MGRMSSGSSSSRVPDAVGPDALTVDAMARRLARSGARQLSIAGFRRAAVLVPVLEASDGLALLFTVRAAGLRRHANEIAFPGGRLEAGETVLDAALRETFEEVGLTVAPEDVLGTLSDHPSPAGYVATPVVARVPWPQPVTLDPGEVAEVFTVPLAELVATEPESEVRTMQHYRRRIFAYTCRGRRIWGFTGNVVHDLLEVVHGVADHVDGHERPRSFEVPS